MHAARLDKATFSPGVGSKLSRGLRPPLLPLGYRPGSVANNILGIYRKFKSLAQLEIYIFKFQLKSQMVWPELCAQRRVNLIQTIKSIKKQR